MGQHRRWGWLFGLSLFGWTLAPGLVQASSWSECHWEVVVRHVDRAVVSWHYRRFMGADGTDSGFRGAIGCRMHAASSIPLESIQSGMEWLEPNAVLSARWSFYSGMTPDGPISTAGWTVSPVDLD